MVGVVLYADLILQRIRLNKLVTLKNSLFAFCYPKEQIIFMQSFFDEHK